MRLKYFFVLLIVILFFLFFLFNFKGNKKNFVSTFISPYKISEVHRAISEKKVWLNTSRALDSNDLKGKIILLDFWTFCCINCMHVLPELDLLEKEFGSQLTVIGVHSAKFTNEKDTHQIQQAILRYEIKHPVINDSDFSVWNQFGVSSWPTFVLIHPSGKIDQVFTGEGHLEELRRSISKIISDEASNLNLSPLPLQLEKTKIKKTELFFPGKIAYHPTTKILFISDSSHHRILGIQLSSLHESQNSSSPFIYEIGQKGISGNKDGDFDQAQFSRPQGLLIQDDVIYVADTENHLIRKIDLKNKKVSTVAGTGQPIAFNKIENDSNPLKKSLSSPWSLTISSEDSHEIIIAMSGVHQLWGYHLKNNQLRILAGNGNEGIADGVYPYNSLSQPSALSSHKNQVFFLDSETSSLRVYDKGEVKTLIGSGLFQFGFQDGNQQSALLQHPLGIWTDESGVYIADTYNHAIRHYDISTKILSTLLKTEKLNEPSDLLKVGDFIYIADTNHHKIQVFNLKTKKLIPVQLFNEQDSELSSDVVLKNSSQVSVQPNKKLPNLKEQKKIILAHSKPIHFNIKLPQGYELNHKAPSSLHLFIKNNSENFNLIQDLDYSRLGSLKGVLIHSLEKNKVYQLQATLYYCPAGSQKSKSSVCTIASIDYEIETEAHSSEEVQISF